MLLGNAGFRFRSTRNGPPSASSVCFGNPRACSVFNCNDLLVLSVALLAAWSLSLGRFNRETKCGVNMSTPMVSLCHSRIHSSSIPFRGCSADEYAVVRPITWAQAPSSCGRRNLAVNVRRDRATTTLCVSADTATLSHRASNAARCIPFVRRNATHPLSSVPCLVRAWERQHT